MGKLCMIMHLITLCITCITFMLVAHTYIIAINHEEQGLEKPSEVAPFEAGNHEQDQGKPRYI
jgi:NADH:ubiquinone oxidoreductase subunit 3 (subunit A)